MKARRAHPLKRRRARRRTGSRANAWTRDVSTPSASSGNGACAASRGAFQRSRWRLPTGVARRRDGVRRGGGVMASACRWRWRQRVAGVMAPGASRLPNRSSHASYGRVDASERDRITKNTVYRTGRSPCASSGQHIGGRRANPGFDIASDKRAPSSTRYELMTTSCLIRPSSTSRGGRRSRNGERRRAAEEEIEQTYSERISVS